jgi:hypothetical protein
VLKLALFRLVEVARIATKMLKLKSCSKDKIELERLILNGT